MAFPCGYNHSMASCASSTRQWPTGGKYLPMGHIMAPSGPSPANFRPSADACTKVVCERRKYWAWKAIFSNWSDQHGSFPCIWGGPSSFGGEKKETNFLLHWFQQCSSLRPFTKSLYYIWELCRTGGFVSVECRAGHISSLWSHSQWRLPLASVSRIKNLLQNIWSSGFQHIFKPSSLRERPSIIKNKCSDTFS